MKRKFTGIFILVFLLIFSIDNVEATEISDVDGKVIFEESTKVNKLEEDEDKELDDPSEEPEEPIDPEEPIVPEEPEEPIDPEEPEEPVDPEEPEEPIDPEEPEEPVDPEEPEEPEEPEGWVKENEFWYYYKDGEKIVDKWIWAEIDLDNDGKADGHNWKYFDKSGKNITLFYKDGFGTWLSQAGPDMEYLKGWWQNEVGMKYYFRESSGTRVTGFQHIDGAWRYFRTSGTMATGWQYIDGGWRYFRKDGSQVRDKWVWLDLDLNKDGKTDKQNWKYFNKSGLNVEIFYRDNGNVWLSQTGPNKEYLRGWWTNEAGMKYFFRKSSGMRVEGWQFIDGSWRFFRDSGTLATGWQKIDGKWYYFRSTGKPVSGLQTINGNKYIFSSGSRPYRYSNKKNFEYKGKIYNIYSNGVAVELDRFGWNYSNGRLTRYDRNGSRIESTYVGSRFILVDLNMQKMYLYNNGVNKVTTDVITGKPSTPTITGHFVVQHKERARYLRGRYYVDYWIPFSGDYGIHDANWQTASSFKDKNAYTYVGSHGCVNTPIGSMGAIYNNIRIGDPVIVFK